MLYLAPCVNEDDSLQMAPKSHFVAVIPQLICGCIFTCLSMLGAASLNRLLEIETK
jgi:hypothetical protein